MGSSLTPGTQIGRYQIRSKIGEGGMGEVYLALDTELDRTVAIKILPEALATDQQRLQRFIQEAKAASALNHPNILTIHEIGTAGALRFIATEFIDGETLRGRIKSGSKLANVMEIGIQVTGALAAAHAAGIVHRDIKPENIMVRRDGIVKVLDFGLAKLVDQSVIVDTQATTRFKTDPGTRVGTAIYMSPEQARGLDVDARTDIFSLGVVLYEMVAGCLPFEGATTSELLASRLSEREPQPLARYSREVPAELERIVSKALRKEREQRYQTTKDLLLDLQSLKQQLDFDAKLERSTPPEASGAQATISAASPTAYEQAAPTAPVTGSLAGRIKHHRRGLMIALAVMVAAAAGVAYWFYSERPATRTSPINSIVVLPLVNASNDPNTEYLSDGISEALINSLTELQQLRVIARSTAFRYKGKEVDPQAVGDELNVRAVLMGRVRQTGETLNIQVDLVDAATGAQLWGQEYERKASDVLSVKQAIVREVTEKLRLGLSGEDQRRLVKRDRTNAEAYSFYLRGRYFWNKRTAEGIKKAIGEFQQAIDRDPNYALGYVGLADCYVVLEDAGVPSSESLPKARAAADRALQLDDSLAEAHASSGLIYQNQWRWAEAEAEYRRAISLNPNYPTAHHWFSVYFRSKRQFDDSMREIKQAQELDPLSPVISLNVAIVFLLKNDPSSAIEQCQRIIELNPNFLGVHEFLGLAYLKQRRYEEATAEFQKAVGLSGRASPSLHDLGYCYAVTGRRAEALAILKELEERYARREATGLMLASMYAKLGEKDQAFAWLERGFEQRSGELQYITTDFGFEDLRSDPRYADLVRRMGLQP